MKKIIALGGSNNKASINKKLAVYTANKIDNVEVKVIDLNDYDLPIYGIDLETQKGIPSQVKDIESFIESADGIILSLAEHNGSYTVAFKNIIDWLSRLDQKFLKNKPMLLMATSPGGRGGASVHNTAKSTFPHFGGNIVAEFILPKFGVNFSGDIVDPELSLALQTQVELFEKSLK